VFAAVAATTAWGPADGATTETAKLVTESTLIPSTDAGIQLYLREKMPNVLAGVDIAREEADRTMLARRFPRDDPVSTMHRPNEPADSVPGLFVLDDWR
jgi:hypothetical protein